MSPCNAPYSKDCKGLAGSNYAWDASPKYIIETSSALFTGVTNIASMSSLATTNAAVAIKEYNEAYLAKPCEEPLKECSIWYLPSQAELAVLWVMQDLIGGLPYNYYWTSSEYRENGPTDAWFIHPTRGFMGYSYKSSTFKVCPVRAFQY